MMEFSVFSTLQNNIRWRRCTPKQFIPYPVTDWVKLVHLDNPNDVTVAETKLVKGGNPIPRLQGVATQSKSGF